MNYSEIKEFDIANGPGIRLTLFVSGCSHHCKGCFQPQTWDPAFGEPFTKEAEDAFLETLGQTCYAGITLLGGEPLELYNQDGLLPLLRRVKELYPEKTIWCFTGFVYGETIPGTMPEMRPETEELLSLIDVLVDGPFVEEKKDITLLFKGSSNQRTIDLKQTRKTGVVTEWEPGGVSVSTNAHL